MDLTQTKLTKTEWNNVEIPVSDDEKRVLQLIKNGYEDVNIRLNINHSIFQVIKIEINSENELFLYKKYFENEIKEIVKKYGKQIEFSINSNITKQPKKVDIIRIENLDSQIKNKRSFIFEYTLLEFCRKILKSLYEKTTNYAFELYTIIQIKKASIPNINKFVLQFIDLVINFANKNISVPNIIHQAYDFIEKNPALLKYEDMTLFHHQKQLFSIFKKNERSPKLVLYIAPTGTGKTLSPLGLSEQYCVIFLCVSRQVGLALAKSAISMEKRVAFAFGCETASDIRLHYFAAANYSINKYSGGIGKVDNSDGRKVEIIICDIQSYLIAMHYMLAFNQEHQIITYWDEPTITMDYQEHPLHSKIHENWKENKISKVVLSCATLPKEHEIQDSIMDFKERFDGAEVHTINSFDFKKTISILNKDGKCVLPHLLYSDYQELLKCVIHCENNKTLLRYFDLTEIIRYIKYINETDYIDDDYKVETCFTSISDITMNSLKLYYLETLKHINPEKWTVIYQNMKISQKSKFEENKPVQVFRRTTSVQEVVSSNTQIMKTNSVDAIQTPVNPNPNLEGILLTTNDAHTLTDGPTIFLAEDVEKIGKFYIQNSKIPTVVLQKLMEKIGYNNDIQQKMTKLQKMLDDKSGSKESSGVGSSKKDKKDKKDRKEERKELFDPEISRLSQQIDDLRQQIRSVNLNNIYVPNTKEHQEVWSSKHVDNAYVPNIVDSTVKEIMELDVDNSLKILLLLGIGMFTANQNTAYLEIMKKLAYEQKLYIIIASSDYIYGTNYSFCHGFIGKDLTKMTQQKIIQAIGRIGRNKIQQEYTIRFRDDEIMTRLFEPVKENLEAINMSRLFVSC